MAQKRPDAFEHDFLLQLSAHSPEASNRGENKQTNKHQTNTYKTKNYVEAGNKGNPLLIHRKKKNSGNFAG